MRILRAEDHKRMPWKNGGGETVEIAVFPDGAGLDDFDWRVSMARVEGDGPFSSFPGIDRTLAILDGAGMVLEVDGQPSLRLTLETGPHAFPADASTSAQLIDGTVTDLNVMTRRGKVEHSVKRIATAKVSPAGSVRLILCSRGTFEITTIGKISKICTFDAVLLEHSENVWLKLGADSHFHLVEFGAV